MSSLNQQPVVEDIVTVFETTQNQSWSIFNDKLNSVSNKNSKKKDPVKSENSITLTSDDVPVFGLVPRLDKVMLVSCNECAMIVKRDCIHSHFYRRHNSNNSHSEADKFSLVNFLSTVKTNKNKKLKMTVRKPPEKKINEREKVNTVVKEIKTEFDQIEYERLLEANRAKIKEENTTEYVDQHNVDMVTTSCNPNTSSGNFDWDVKPCIKSETQCTDHKVNEEIIEHNKDFNKLSTASLDNKKDLQSNKYLDIQNTEHVVNNVASSNRLLKLDRNKKMKPNVTIDFSGFMYGDEEEYCKKYHKCKNKYQKLPHKIKNIKEKSKLTIKNEYSDIMDNKNYNDISTFYNQSSNTSADVKIEYYKLFSGLQNDCEQTKLFPCNKYLDVKNEIPSDSYSTSYHQPTESPKEEFKNIPNNIYPNIKIKEEYDENNDKYKVELCSSDKNNSEVISHTCSSNVDSNLSTIFPCSSVNVKEEVTITESSENIMNNESSDDTFVSNNQSSIAILNINEVSKPLLIPTNTIEESKSSLNIDLNNEKSKHSLITDYITDNSYTEYFQLYTNSIPQLSPSYKYLDDNNLNDELNLQDEDNLNNQLSLQVEEDFNDKLNYQENYHFNDELNLQRKDNLSYELSLQDKKNLNDKLYLQDEEDLNNELFLDVKDFIDEIDLQPVDDLTEKINWQSDDDLDNELNFQGQENLNVEFNLQGEGESSMDLDYQDEDNLKDELNHQSVNNFDVKFSMLNEDNLSDREDLKDEKNISSKDNLNSGDVKINENLKYDCLMPSSQLQNNEKEAKQTPNKECSVIINNEISNVTLTGHDQSSTVTLDNEKESEVNSIIDDAYVVVDNDGIVDNFENEYYRLSPELYDHDAQTSFTPTYKYSDVISNESSDNSDESVSIHDQSSIESLDVRDQTDNSSTENSSDFTSEENFYDSDSGSTIGSSNQSTELYDITKKPIYTQTNCLEDHEQFMDRISEKLAKSFGSKVGKNNCTHTNANWECMNCCKTSEDFIDTSGTQIDEHSVPINSNIQIDEYDVNNFTPISSSAQIINNTIIPKDVEEYELKDNNDCDCNVSNRSHYLSHFHPHPCNTASQNNNLMHSPINENDCEIYNSEHYKSNEHILYGNTINEMKPFIDKNNEIYKEFMKIVDNSVPERKCKIMPYTRIVKNLKRKLKRRVADDKENCNHLISRGFKKFKVEFIDRDISCSDESDNNDNVDD